MGKIRILLLSITALLAVSCSKDDSVEQNAPDSFKFTLDATLPDMEGTRASVDAVVRIKWAVGDKLSVINLTTGKALGGNLTADASGIKSKFSGTLTGTVNSGDKLAFLYPSQGYTAETAFSGATLDFSKQNGSVSDKLAVYATYTATGRNISSADVTFNYLMSYMKITLSDIAVSPVVKSAIISEINNTLTLSISGGNLVATTSGAGKTISVTPASPITTNSLGFATLRFAVPAISAGVRSITFYDGSYDYKTIFTNADFSSGKYCNMAVAGGDLPKLVYIPDANFKAALVTNFDTDSDGEISAAEALSTTSIDCKGKGITDLTGIEKFTNLTSLDCGNNQLTTLDVSHNAALTTLKCNNNRLTTMNLSYNTELATLYCNNNRFTTINFVYNMVLRTLYCAGQTTDGTTSRNFVINANATQYSTWTNICQDEDATVSCVGSPFVYIPDANFKSALVANYDANSDGEISYEEALNTSEVRCDYKYITDITGIEAFIHLDILVCNNNHITTIDLSHNTALTGIQCNDNDLTAINVSSNAQLRMLKCDRNRLTTIDISANTLLEKLYCEGQTSDGTTWQNIVIQANASQYPNWTTICLDENDRVSCVKKL